MTIKIKDPLELVKHTRTFANVKFLHRGRTRKGVDCGGLIIASLKELGYETPEMVPYGREPKDDSLRQYLIKNVGEPLDKAQIKVGDVALIKFTKEPHHVALIGDYILDKNSFTLIHSYGWIGKVVEHRLDSKWFEKIVEIYRFEIE